MVNIRFQITFRLIIEGILPLLQMIILTILSREKITLVIARMKSSEMPNQKKMATSVPVIRNMNYANVKRFICTASKNNDC